jgi:hypothetical protein
VTDLDNHKTYLVRKEAAGLNVFEEDGPARMAQFVSSGLKNVKDDIAMIARLLGFAFPLIDLTPTERLVWKEDFPVPLTFDPQEQARLAPAVRDRLSGSPLRLPSRHWPPGTRVKIQPDFTWRIDLVRDERPDAQRQEFSHPEGDPPVFDVDHINDTYRKIALRHADQIDKMRFSRGVVYQSNLGLVSFQLEGEDLFALHDLYTNRPDQDEGVLLNRYRVPLQLFDDQRPLLQFIKEEE